MNRRLASLRRALEETREQARNSGDNSTTERFARIRPLPRLPVEWPRRRRVRDSTTSTAPTDNPRTPATDTSDELDDGRRRKRRKTHHAEPEQSFKYGRYGQVEAGRLKLYVESCDGNVHDDRGGIYYGPDNILKHDKSVYCTRSSHCNIILRHHDASPFTLDKLHILAPENGFTAPLKEGLVYVAMNREDLLPHLRNDDAQVPPILPPRSPPNRHRDSVHLSLLESLNDPDISRALSHHRSRDWSPFDSSAEQNSASPENDPSGDDWPAGRDGGWPPSDPSTTRRRTLHQSADPSGCDDQADPVVDDDTQVIMLTDDEVTYPEDPSRPDVLEDRQRRERSMAYLEDDDMYGWDTRFRAAHPRMARGRRPMFQRKDRGEVLPSPQLDQDRNDGVTRARFQIKDGKHKVAIKFSPPISGTHILLKLQTPYVGKNIDIQTVIASGYAGPRYATY